MADLIRTKCGRIPNLEKLMFGVTMLTSYFKECYKKPFSPVVPKSFYFVRKSMGCHSGMSARFNLSKMLHKQVMRLFKIEYKTNFRSVYCEQICRMQTSKDLNRIEIKKGKRYLR